MHFNTLSALTLLAVFASVHAQSDTATAPTPTSTDGISDCLLACVTQAGASTGCSFGDASCLCSNQQFQEQALTCLQSQCEEADIEAAQAILQSQCGTSGECFGL
ncbi:hypothetical protein C8Q76DRAFT_637298 [Earliella scabrosa]|nr:hypothetical protein C8Q76DRAFT_637298 [Earliella scabrosa]